MQAAEYWVLRIDNIPENLEEELTQLLFELGASGVQENLVFEQFDKKFLPKVIDQESKSLLIYFEDQPVRAVGQIIANNYPQVSWHIEKKESQDWQSEWKKSWQPFALTENCWVVPTWMQSEFKNESVEKIYIDPGMAFGTGTHATTQIASSLLEECILSHPVKTAVDVGTGSGILSILMEKRGVEKILAYDNDPEAERVFHENLTINHCSRIKWEPSWEECGPYALLVANIIDGVLLELKPLFQKSIASGSFLIFTGILKEREKDFLHEMCANWNIEMIKRLEKDEWAGFLFRKNS